MSFKDTNSGRIDKIPKVASYTYPVTDWETGENGKPSPPSHLQQIFYDVTDKQMEKCMEVGLLTNRFSIRGFGIDLMAAGYHMALLKYKDWINDLQSGLYVNCVYCGHRYGKNGEVKESMADVLKQHIETCPEHPMSKLKLENMELKLQNAELKLQLKLK